MIDEITLQIIFQLILASVLGLFIGFERWRKRKAAGMRTFSLVSLSSALFTAIAVEGFSSLGFASVDPLRVIQAVAIGIGFIGAGIIFLKNGGAHGLTTAAGIWLAAAVGVAVGVNMYFVAIFATILALVILIVLRKLESKLSSLREEDDD